MELITYISVALNIVLVTTYVHQFTKATVSEARDEDAWLRVTRRYPKIRGILPPPSEWPEEAKR